MSNKKKLIPALRFPEFKEDGEWEEKKLGEILLSTSSNLALNKLVLKLKGKPVYGADGIVGYIDEFQHPEEYISVVKDGSGVGRLNFCIAQSSILGTLTCLKSSNKDRYNLKWIYFLLQTVDFSTFVKGSGIPHIYYADYKNELLPVAYMPEQQKIADCLSSLDDLLAAHNEKLELLKGHKKGLMQNLFPQEGERVPKFRFPEFENDGEWRYLNGNELFQPISNKKHNSDLPILAITQDLGAIPRDLIEYTVIATKNSIKNYKVVEKGDFIISLRSFQGGIEYSLYHGICSPAYIILRKRFELNDEFYKHYFKTPLYIQCLNRNIEGIRDGKMVSYNQFSEIALPYPQIPEQKKIASCLSAADHLIKAETEKIEALKEHKKGLMQGLFPKIEN